MLAETICIADRCQFSLDQLRYDYPQEVVPKNESPTSWLRKLTDEGMHRRWPLGVSTKVQAQIKHELALIADLHYETYFLTVHDIVLFARENNILCQGRGSAANSAVCYCLGITEVDPSRMEMLFERFISRERNEPPDIDVDFENERREEIIQYIYQKYGRERAAIAATVITYQPRSAMRDVGKALGLDLEQVDRLSKSISGWDRQPSAEILQEAGFDPRNPLIARLLDIAGTLIGFPRHLSQHVGGFVISNGPLSRLVPIENAAMPERTIIQWDKDDLDSLGLLKFDCLALGMLTAIHRALDLIAKRRGHAFSLADIPPEDPQVYAMIQQADTIGVFQIESRAQMAMLPRLKPRTFYDLVIEVALIRPGPIQGNMVHPYLRRRQGLELTTYPSPEAQAVLERTLGVPIFQEQVMKLAIVAAGFSAGEADQLRRAMAAWRRKGGLEPFEARLLEGMRERGYAASFAQQIVQQIRGFGEYGFPESHAASFALLVYISAWLKCHEPAAFTCALFNSQPMGFYGPAQLVQDARRHNVEIYPADVSHSDWDCTVENSAAAMPALRLGLRMIKGLSQLAAKRIITARGGKEFRDMQDLIHRASLSQRDAELLASSNALASFSTDRRQAYWRVLGVDTTLPLFNETPTNEALPMLTPPSEGENLVADYASLGLTLGRHPLALLRPRLAKLRILNAQQLRNKVPGTVIRIAGLVISRQRPGSASGVTFVTLEDETGLSNIIVWQQLAEQQRRILLQARLLGVDGKLEREGDVLHVIAHRLEDLSPLLGKLHVASRDFH